MIPGVSVTWQTAIMDFETDSETHTDPEQVEDTINELGAQGWEVTSTYLFRDPSGVQIARYVLKKCVNS